jgi:hypothetical protein
MRRILLLCVFLVLPLSNAYADTMDLFTLTGGGHTQVWLFPAVETFTYPEVPIFVPAFTPISQSQDGVPVINPLAIAFFPPGRGLTLQYPLLSGPSVIDVLSSSGPYFDPHDYEGYFIDTLTFTPGTFSVLSAFTPGMPQIPYSLTITPVSGPATPEPSTITLLLTGACTLFAARKRLRP